MRTLVGPCFESVFLCYFLFGLGGLAVEIEKRFRIVSLLLVWAESGDVDRFFVAGHGVRKF